MRKLAIAAAAAMSLVIAPAAAATDMSASAVTAVAAQQGDEAAGGIGDWVWLLGTIGVIVGILALTGGEETSAPVSP